MTPARAAAESVTADRGFRNLPPIPGTHGGRPAGHVKVSESSAANGPHLWISASHPSDRNDPNSPPIEGCVHIRAEDAWRFADQIRYLVEHHYQGSFPAMLQAAADPRDNSYTAAQLARSDALAAAAWVLNAFTLDDIAETLLDVARPLATWIEHGDPATPQT